MKFNLHLGVPAVAPNLLHQVATKCALGGRRSAHFVNLDEWKSIFRGVINARPEEVELDQKGMRNVRRALGKLSAHSVVAASQHALLGSSSDCFFKKRTLPYAARRLDRLAEIFSEVDLTIHLAITTQLDHFQQAKKTAPNGAVTEMPIMIPSWSDLVSLIRARLPNAAVVVWDFEEPQRVALAFATNVLNIADDTLVTRARNTIIESGAYSNVDPNKGVGLGLPRELADELDQGYEADLRALSSMDGVTLVTWDKVPSEFYLDG